jgi:hypothetical protein
MAAYVNYPLTATDDDEFFDAPLGSSLLKPNGDVAYRKADAEFGWESASGAAVSAGVVWGSLFADGNPWGDEGLRPGYVLRVPLDHATRYDMCEGGWQAAEARAEARVAAWMAEARS